MHSSHTEIATLGEFGLIDHLTEGFALQNAETLKGVGDDCAVMDYNGSGKRVLVTTDMLMEGIHFDLIYTPMKHLGYKAAQVNFSDVYAMNGRPNSCWSAWPWADVCPVEALEDFYAGLRLACDTHGVDLVGGDTTSSLTGLAISRSTCIGEAAGDSIVYRNGAKTPTSSA